MSTRDRELAAEYLIEQVGVRRKMGGDNLEVIMIE